MNLKTLQRNSQLHGPHISGPHRNFAAPVCGLGTTENKISLAPARIKPLFLRHPAHSLHWPSYDFLLCWRHSEITI